MIRPGRLAEAGALEFEQRRAQSVRERHAALAAALRRFVLEIPPAPALLVLEGLDPEQLQTPPMAPDPRARGRRAMKDLRDTFASQLLTAGVQLGYVSAQLGHADVGVTTYARW